MWVLRIGVGWRDLPVDFDAWEIVYSCFRTWTRNGLWQAILQALSAGADREYLLIDSTAVRTHAHGARPAGGQLAQAMGRSKASLSTKIHLACDALGYPLGFILTGANVPTSTSASPFCERHLQLGTRVIMEKGFDSDAIRAYVNQLGGVAVIAIHARRIIQPAFDEHLYHERHHIENLFARLKPSAASPPAMKNFTPPSPRCSPSPAS